MCQPRLIKASRANYLNGMGVYKNAFNANDGTLKKNLVVKDINAQVVSNNVRAISGALSHKPITSQETVSDGAKEAKSVIEKVVGERASVVITNDSTQNRAFYNPSEGVIYINNKANLSGEDVAKFVAMHEITHTTEGTEYYDELEEVLVDISKDASAPQALKDKIGDLKERQAEIGRKYEDQLKNQNALQQIYTVETERNADLIGELLGNDYYINKLANRNLPLLKKIYLKIKGLIQKSADTDSASAKYLNKLASKFAKAIDHSQGGVKISQLGPNEDEENRLEIEPVRFSKEIVPGSDEMFVLVEKASIQKLMSYPGETMQAKVRNYLKQFRGTVLPLGSTNKVYIRREAEGEYTNPAKSVSEIDYEGKLNAASEFENLLQSAKYLEHKEDNGRHPDATRGWNYYELKYVVPTSNGIRAYKGQIQIKLIDRGDCFYDITKIEDITSGSAGQALIKAAGSAYVSSNNSISEKTENVNDFEENNDVRYSKASSEPEFVEAEDLENKKISLGMRDAERAVVLKNTTIKVQKIEMYKDLGVDIEALQQNQKSKIEKDLKNKLQELGCLRKYRTSNVDIEFDFTANSLYKSMNSQVTDYGGNLEDLSKVVINMQKLLDNSVLLEIHKDKAKRENSRLLKIFVLLSAFQEENNITPVQFEIKQYIDNENRLYLAVALTKIETGVMGDTALLKEGRTRLLPVSTISISQLIKKINPVDKNFFKYIPDEMLSKEQLDSKRLALEKENIKYGRVTDNIRYSKASSEPEFVKAEDGVRIDFGNPLEEIGEERRKKVKAEDQKRYEYSEQARRESEESLLLNDGAEHILEDVFYEKEKTLRNGDRIRKRSPYAENSRLKKYIADNILSKVYALGDSKELLKNILGDLSYYDEYDSYKVSLKGASRKSIEKALWDALNTSVPGERTKAALEIADYILSTATANRVVEYTEEVEVALRTVEFLRQYLHQINLDYIKEDIKVKYDKDKSVFARWQKAKDKRGVTADSIKAEFEEVTGLRIDAINEADIFLALDEIYMSSLEVLKDNVPKKSTLMGLLDEKAYHTLQQKIAREVLQGFDKYGKESRFSVLEKKYVKEINKLSERAKNAYEYNSLVNNVLREVWKIVDSVNRKYKNATQSQTDVLKNVKKMLTKIKHRANLNRSSVRVIMAELSKWYTKDNPVLQNFSAISEDESKNIGFFSKDIRGLLDYFSEENNVQEQQDGSSPVIEISMNSELATRIKNSNKSKYTVIKEYLIEKFYGEEFTLSDGRKAIMDKRDAQELAHKADDVKTAELVNLKEIVEKADFSHIAENVNHNKFDRFYYYSLTVKMGSDSCDILINIGRTKNDGIHHIYDITKDNKKRRSANQSPTGLSRPVGNAMKNASSIDSITENSQNVNNKKTKSGPLSYSELQLVNIILAHMNHIFDNYGKIYKNGRRVEADSVAREMYDVMVDAEKNI